MESIVLNVEPRICNKNEAKKLRKEGKVPAVVYQKGIATVHVCVSELSLDKLVHSSASRIVELEFPDGGKKRSFLKDVQFDRVTDQVIHADFQFFSAGEVLEMEIPTSFTGESPGVVAGGNMQVIQHTLTVKGKPSNIPQHLTIDISGLELGQTMHISEIPAETFDGKFEIMGDPDTPVVSILAPKVEAEEPETDVEEAAEEIDTTTEE
ncbi:MAG: 50S ribosomal protein L25/general stress protein Ctc [Chlorobiales bacterium]|nr:50S ribosomal protein L25/general stress protein Ctc [Chlorobiales bacterium]